MLLRSLEIKNFLSLEDVKLDRLVLFNVLIGRNNAGKSAVFSALLYLSRILQGQDPPGASGEDLASVTHRDAGRALEMRLGFKPRPLDRTEFINLVVPGPGREVRRKALLDSPFLREVVFTFRSPVGSPRLLHLRETGLLAEDGQWAVIQRLKDNDNDRVNNPSSQVTQFDDFIRRSQAGPFNHNTIDVKQGAPKAESSFYATNWHTLPAGDPNSWLRRRLFRYLTSCFFFNPFRHSAIRLNSSEVNELAQDGANLAQVLATILGRSRRKLEQIEQFIHAAVPGLGSLQTPPRGSQTEVGFRSATDDYFVHLHDMGGGIEQVLMVATVLLTTDETSTIFLEEPESHLHPGALRFLVDKLRTGERQVFITTHSPILLNTGHLKRVYMVTHRAGRTTIDRLDEADPLGELLEDIGARNSDVLMSDAVLFVEGPADTGALNAWSKTLGSPLVEHNVTVLGMGGGEHAARGAPIRSQVLEGISQRAPVPHLFVLDRDERGQGEIDGLEKALREHLHLLQRRELENYLLSPRAIRAAIRSKCRDDPAILQKVDQTPDEEVSRLIQEAADCLYPVVLLKRIRAELGGLPGGLLTREVVRELVPAVGGPDLAAAVRDRLQQRVADHLGTVDIDGIVRAQKEALDKEWAEPSRRVCLAPGEEILEAVFGYFSSTYAKPKDAERIAKEMTADEIDPEIHRLIKSAVTLADRPAP